jgi:hypothetical protein
LSPVFFEKSHLRVLETSILHPVLKQPFTLIFQVFLQAIPRFPPIFRPLAMNEKGAVATTGGRKKRYENTL